MGHAAPGDHPVHFSGIQEVGPSTPFECTRCSLIAQFGAPQTIQTLEVCVWSFALAKCQYLNYEVFCCTKEPFGGFGHE
jgi:hypothetical protein